MIKAQEYLDTNYPKEDRKEIEVLDISRELLEGHLVLEGFANLKELDCSNNRLTSLTLINLANLKELSCNWNELVSLNLENTNNLEKIWCRDNNLTDLSFLEDLNHEALEELNILNNNFYEQDLSFLRKFINLKDLLISDNHFIGSLEPLRNMSKLKSLSIESTDIDSGLEYLPDSIQYLGCNDSKPGSKVKKIHQELRKHGKPFGYCSANLLPLWKKVNSKKVRRVQRELVNSSEAKKINGPKRVEEILKRITQTDFATEEKQSKEENEDLKKEKVKIETDTLGKISIVNINNNTFSPNNNVQQIVASPSPNQAPQKKVNRWEKFQKSFKLFWEAVTGK